MADTPLENNGVPQAVMEPASPGTADTPATNESAPATNFLGNTPNVSKPKDTLYDDFFHENPDGNITVGTESKKSSLETFVNIMKYVTIFVIIIGILATLHVFIRTSQAGGFLSGYPFLCSYLNYDIDASSEDKGCKTISAIKSDYDTRYANLRDDIITELNKYLPVQVGASILSTSPERSFAVSKFDTKANPEDVLVAFSKVRESTLNSDAIKCDGFTVRGGDTLSTQCTIYGGPLLNDTDNNFSTPLSRNNVASSRIQALRFLESLSETSKTSLILQNPPTTLSIEKLSGDEKLKTGYDTRSVIPVQVRFLPISQKP